MDHSSTYESLFKHTQKFFVKNNLKAIFVKNKQKAINWFIYNNVVCKKSLGKQNKPLLTTPKANSYPKKVMLCIFWDWKDIVYYNHIP